VYYDPEENLRSAERRHDVLNALVAPRPIGWISSMGADGSINLAPFSYFNAVSSDPPIVMVAISDKPSDGTPKDTLRNVREVPQFVANIVSWELREAMNSSSKGLSYGASEFDFAGLSAAASVAVKPPRVAAAKAALECEVIQIVPLPEGSRGRNHVVFGRVVGVHVDDSVIVDGRIDPRLVGHVARLGYHDYLFVRDVFVMRRPDKPAG
jgi:flavin reductase (DIM6/NTAB) family NADH-FMN oxidoreductase RutF